MPYNRNDFYNGSGVPRRILPSFDFRPVIRPYAGAPIEEFANTVQSLRKDYETASITDDALEQSYKSMQNLDAPGDEQLAQELKEKYRQRLQQRADQGDYENMVRQTRKDAMNFAAEYDPIKRNLESYNQYIGDLQKRNDITDKQRLIDFTKNQYVQSGGLQRDPVTGQVKNQFSGRNFVGDVNVPEVIDKAMAGTIKSLYPDKIAEIEQYGLLEFAKREHIPLSKIRQIARTALEQNPNVVPYLQQEQMLAGEQPYDKDQIINNAIEEYAIPKYGGVRKDVNYMQNAIQLEKLKRAGDAKSLSDIVTSQRTEGVKISPADYKTIEKQNRELKDQIQYVNDLQLKRQYKSQIEWNDSYLGSIKKQVKEQLTPEEQTIYDKFGDLEGAAIDSKVGFESGMGVSPNSDVVEFSDRYSKFPLKNKYSTVDIANILEKANRKVEEIVEATNIATDFTAFGGSEGTSQNPHTIGATNAALTEMYKNTSSNYQLGFGDQQISEKYLTEKYKNTDGEIKLPDGRKVKGRDSSKDIINVTNGVDFKGRPLLELTIRNEDGEKLGSELITSKDEGVISNVKDVGMRLIQDDDPIRKQQGFSVIGGLEFLPYFWQAGAQTNGEKQWSTSIVGNPIITEKVGDSYKLKFAGREKTFDSPTQLATFLAQIKYTTQEEKNE